MHGGLLVDKPCGPTSHDVVAFIRRLLKTTRVGHTGTLDPLATGLLVMLVGQATRLSQFLVGDDKEYIADIRLGAATATYDAESLPQAENRGSRVEDRGSRLNWPADGEIEAALAGFRGSFLQVPPPFSAKKIGGVAAYDRARKNQPVDLKPAPVTVRELQILPVAILEPGSSLLGQGGLLRLRVMASSGFYVRSLAHDLGQVLGCGGHLEALRRTGIGAFRVEQAAPLDLLEAAGSAAAQRLIPMSALLGDLPAVSLTEEGLRRASNGNSLAPQHLAHPGGIRSGARVKVLTHDGEVLSVAEHRPDGLLHPLLVLR